MATLATWLDVETEVEKQFGVYLGTTLGLPVVKSDSDTLVVVPRIELVAVVEEMGPHQWTIPSGTYAARRIYDQFKISVNVDLVYSPHWQAVGGVTSGNQSGQLRGQLRNCLGAWTQLQALFTSGGLLNLASDSLRQTSGSRLINDAEKEEKLTTQVAGMFFLNTNVIPT